MQTKSTLDQLPQDSERLNLDSIYSSNYVNKKNGNGMLCCSGTDVLEKNGETNLWMQKRKLKPI